MRVAKACSFATVLKREGDVEKTRTTLNSLDGRIDHGVVWCIKPGDEGV